MFWLVVLLIAAAIAATFAAYVLWGLDWPTRDPPLRAGPVIVAADPLSAHAIRLTIERGGVGPVEVELERTILPDAPPTLLLFTLFGIHDDEGLVPDTLYQYRVRFTNPISAWSAPKSARTLVNALNEGELIP